MPEGSRPRLLYLREQGESVIEQSMFGLRVGALNRSFESGLSEADVRALESA